MTSQANTPKLQRRTIRSSNFPTFTSKKYFWGTYRRKIINIYCPLVTEKSTNPRVKLSCPCLGKPRHGLIESNTTLREGRGNPIHMGSRFNINLFKSIKIRDIEISLFCKEIEISLFEIEISLFLIEISLFQMEISLFIQNRDISNFNRDISIRIRDISIYSEIEISLFK